MKKITSQYKGKHKYVEKKTRIKLILEIACSSNLNRWNKFLKECQYYRYNLLFLFSFFFCMIMLKKTELEEIMMLKFWKKNH